MFKKNIILKDASAYNVQFIKNKPKFIDILSYELYEDGDYWEGYRQFCEQYLAPLYLYSKLNVPFHKWYRGSSNGISISDLTNLLSLKHKFSLNSLITFVLPSLFESRKNKCRN